MVILLNCVTLGMYQPCENIDCSSDRCQILQVQRTYMCSNFYIKSLPWSLTSFMCMYLKTVLWFMILYCISLLLLLFSQFGHIFCNVFNQVKMPHCHIVIFSRGWSLRFLWIMSLFLLYHQQVDQMKCAQMLYVSMGPCDFMCTSSSCCKTHKNRSTHLNIFTRINELHIFYFYMAQNHRHTLNLHNYMKTYRLDRPTKCKHSGFLSTKAKGKT